jgi:hypothetical protein
VVAVEQDGFVTHTDEPMRGQAMARNVAVLRRTTLGAIVAVLVQSALGMVVNLYVGVPAHHPGSRPSNYLAGSYHSVVWAVGSGAPMLAAHAAFGLALVVMVVAVGISAIALKRTGVTFWSVLGGLLVIGAGFNGSSFLDFGDNVSSLIMAVLALASVGSYAAVLFLLRTEGGGGR